MSRLLGILVVLSLLMPADGGGWTAMDACRNPIADCGEPCCGAPRDEGNDPPPCADCVCCAHPKTPLLTATRPALARQGVNQRYPVLVGLLLSSDPQEILHIPKPALVQQG